MSSSTYRTVGSILATCCLLMGPAAAAQAQTPPTLTDDAGGSPLFPGTTPIIPGESRTACIVIAATGALPDDVITFAATDVTGDLAPFLTITAQAGSGGRYRDCTGFRGSTVYQGPLTRLANLDGDGAPTGWHPAETSTRTFRITATVADTGVPPGITATASFSWRLSRLREPVPIPSTTPPTAITTPPATPPTGQPTPAPSGQPSTGGLVPSVATSPGPSPTRTGPPSRRPTRDPVARLDIPGIGRRADDARATPPGPDWAEVRARLLKTFQEVAEKPGFVLGPLGIALLFLLSQHWIDLRDPKLTAGSRTARESMLRFPSDYRASLDLTETKR